MQGQINDCIAKDKDKVVDQIELEAGKKAVMCRCWNSGTFLYCDGKHMERNKLTGDHMGSVVSVKKFHSATTRSTRASEREMRDR